MQICSQYDCRPQECIGRDWGSETWSSSGGLNTRREQMDDYEVKIAGLRIDHVMHLQAAARSGERTRVRNAEHLSMDAMQRR